MSKHLPGHAQIVIVGGGVVGSSIAYQLTKAGVSDVVLLERGVLTCGTSWHAAGLIMQLRGGHATTDIAKYNAEFYPELEADTGLATGFKQNGTLAIGRNMDRVHEMNRRASLAKSFGIDAHVISPKEVKDMYPALDDSFVAGGLFIPKDGQLSPVDTINAVIAGAKKRGAKVFEGTPVDTMQRLPSGEYQLSTKTGTITCETLVLACGLWTRDFAAQLGARVPLHACEHMYVVTEAMDFVVPSLPVLRDTDGYTYMKEEAGKLLIGSFEPRGKPLPVEKLPMEQQFIEMQEDWDHFELPYSKAMEMIPQLEHIGINKFMNGPESFTPDDLPCLGEAPGLPNCFIAAGLNSEGFEISPGISRALAHWIINGEPDMDLLDYDVARFHPFQINKKYLRERSAESLGGIFDMPWPFKEHETARPARKSHLHDRLAASGACFGETAGWERPMWFAPEGVAPKNEYSFFRPNWYEHTAHECRAAREGVVIMDISSFGKTMVQGRDACAFLQWMCVSNIDVPVGKLIYTHMLNSMGGIECDITVDRRAEECFIIYSSAGVHCRDMNWMHMHIEPDQHVSLTDVTAAYSVLNVQGPKSRELLQSVTDTDLSNEAFPFLTAQEIDIGYARILAKRQTFIGELGWELQVSSEFVQDVYDIIMEAGKPFGLVQAGYHTLEHLRCERAYREYVLDMAPDDTPFEAGLGFIVKMDKPGGFYGREALVPQAGQVLGKRQVNFKLKDPEPALFHDELIRMNGEIVGYLSSGAYGFNLGSAVGMGYVKHPDGVTADLINGSTFEIEIACQTYPAEASLKPFYDPSGARVKM
ncbi:MAG: GcvT family protein [Rhodospirillales bacterium]|jgi:glycine cleavage system aminomethyltransferase T/glycine/D-amino acid oxidase-like deaminating enzyme|nr:GcvT family protein [Rhodospirillales bacterium]MBT4040629.1 GcvT family protein [Rhodospirillales bacterium]MBT4628138.1 GcvT family protein [Rhodospirillales bacterium]MBT5353107.1 GcvT family protein [Rhodospirillales bacterium]MBT5520794.1 GcvT family protein [Rhodospirillales bacterium]